MQAVVWPFIIALVGGMAGLCFTQPQVYRRVAYPAVGMGASALILILAVFMAGMMTAEHDARVEVASEVAKDSGSLTALTAIPDAIYNASPSPYIMVGLFGLTLYNWLLFFLAGQVHDATQDESETK